jgi:hypothetical protein
MDFALRRIGSGRFSILKANASGCEFMGLVDQLIAI